MDSMSKKFDHSNSIDLRKKGDKKSIHIDQQITDELLKDDSKYTQLQEANRKIVESMRQQEATRQRHLEALLTTKEGVKASKQTKKEAEIIINGMKFFGNSLEINSNGITINGKKVVDKTSDLQIQVNGNLDKLVVDECDYVEVSGDVKNVKTMSGDVECKNVTGDVSTVSGDIECKNIGGNVRTTSGDIDAEKIKGKCSTVSGDINEGF